MERIETTVIVILASFTLERVENRVQEIMAVLDILSGFDYLPTEESSQDLFTFVTTFGTYSFIGAPQGWCNTLAFLVTEFYKK